jgi:hypothetical protein
MSVLGKCRVRTARANGRRSLVPVLLAAALASGCDVPFEPYEENTVGPFSIFGYLDLRADTQWIRVTPIRQDLLPDPAPIDAVVTLEHLGSGHVVTLRDSLFTFADPRLNTVGYAHNFWTTEPLEPEATYRLTAVRSDGSATTALVELPAEFEVSLAFLEQIPDRPGIWLPRLAVVPNEHRLYTNVIYTAFDPTVDRDADPVTVRLHPATTGPGTSGFILPGVHAFDGEDMRPLSDMGRREVLIAMVGSDWPYEPGLSASDVAIPGLIPTTVENGVGSVLGVATWTIPLPTCESLEPRPDGSPPCRRTVFDASSASITGKVARDPCGDPRDLPAVRLTERFADGGAVVWHWKTDWRGAYHFQGLRPGSNLRLEFGNPSAGAMGIPPLGPGERYVAPDFTVSSGC